ncbi:hypothetical protein FRC07_000231 [Ceratobasidium sp. 392]|nr:hypothetical protein FRC07_000231 [Ceratobasidium sp. 392]
MKAAIFILPRALNLDHYLFARFPPRSSSSSASPVPVPDVSNGKRLDRSTSSEGGCNSRGLPRKESQDVSLALPAPAAVLVPAVPAVEAGAELESVRASVGHRSPPPPDFGSE